LVWTSRLGRELLCKKGLLPENRVDNVITFPVRRAKRRRHYLEQEAEIIDMSLYRESRDRSVA